MNNDLENLKKKYMAGGTSTTQPAPITQSGSLSSLRDKYSSDIYKTTEATTPAPLPKKGIEITKQSSLAQDGFSFGEKVQATGATISDLGFSLLKGIFRVGEGIADLGTYGVAGIADFFGADDWAEKQREYAKQNTTDETLFDTREMSKMFTDKPMTINTFDLIKEQSFAGESTRQLAEGVGYVGGMVGTGAILGAGSGATAAKTGLSQINVGGLAAKGAGKIGLQLSPKILKAVSNFSIPTASLLTASGSAMSQAYNEGATDGQAFIYGITSGIVEGMVEGLGGISSIKMKALGKGATDTLKKSLVDKVKSNVGKALMNAGVEFFDEGLEEVISGFINPYLQRWTYNKDAANATADELFNEFVMGGLVAGILGMPSVINSMNKKSTSVETTETHSPNTQEQQEIVKEDAKKASIDDAVKGDLRAVDARINFLEDKISTVTNVKNIDIEGIAAELKLLREEKLEITKQASPEIQKEVLEQLTLDLDMLENTPSEQQTEVTQEKIKIKKEQQAKIINEIDKDKVIKTTYNKQFIVDNKESLLVDAQNIVSEMNAKRTTEKPLEIQPETEYDETQQRISDVAAAFKKQVVFLKNSDFGGMVPLQNESLIFIGDNINNDLILSNNKVDQMTYTVGHELFHSLKMSQPEIFNEFTNFIKTEVTEEQLVKFMENYDPTDEFGLLKGIQTDGKFDLETIKADPKKYASQNKALNYIVEEMVANEFGGMITDKKYMTDLKNKNKGLFTKIVNALKTLFNEIDTPIYNSPLTQLQVTKIRKDFEFLSIYVTENLEVKQEVKQEVNVEPKKQEIVEKVVEKVETKKEKIPTKKEAIKSEIKKEKLPKKVEIVEEIEDFETKEPTKEDLMKKKPEPDFIDKSPIKVTQMSLEERKRAIDRNLTNYRREENSRRKTELKNGLIKTYDAYQKAGGTEVIQQIEDFKKEEFKNKITEKKLLPSKEEYAMYHRPSEGPRAFDLLEVNEDISGPKDIYTNPQYYTGTLNKQELQQTMAALNKVKGDPEAMITIYRATPGNEINNGDWVTLSKSYAEQHNESQLDGRGNVLEKTVKAKDIRWALDDLSEWGYFPEITGDTKYLPTKDDRTTGISEFVTNTLEKSPAFDFLREEIKKDPSFGQYEKLSEDVVKSKTEELIKNRLDETIDKIHKGTEVLNPMEQQIAATMINEYDKRGDIDSAMALTKLLQSGTVTPAAQALEAVKRLQKNPYYIVNDFKNMVDKMNEEFMNSDDITIKNWLKEHTKGVELTAGDTEYILQMAKKLENLDENSQEYAQRWALIQNYVANKMPKNFWTKVKNFRRMGFLFNPKTMIRNWAGNVMMDPVYKVTDMFGSKIDEYLSKIYGTTRTTGTTDNKLYRKAKKEGTQISKQDYELGITTSLGNPYEIMAGQTFNPDNLIGRTLNEVEKLTNYLMARGDRGFENAHYVSTLTKLMTLNDVDVATQEMIQLAKDTAAKRTWKNNGKMVKTAGQIRSLFNQIGIKDGKFGKHDFGSKVDIGLGDIILPFIMTPANLLVATYDFSPAAAISAVRNWNDLKETIKKGGNVLDAQKTFVDSVSKATTGTLLFIIAGALAKMGVITGGEDEDKDKRELDKILGNQPYSVKIGDMSFTYDWAQPLSNIFATMGEVQRQKDVGKTNFLKTVGDAFTTGGDRLLEQSFLQNIRTLLGGGYNDDSFGERLIDLTVDIPPSMVPTLFKQFADFLDSDIKSTYDKNSPLQTMIAKTMARIPIVKSALPTKKDVLGNDLKYHSGIGEGVLTSFLSPMNIKRDVAGELGDEITDVFNHTGDKTIIPQVAIKYIDYDSNGDGKAERFNFNPTQQSQLQEAMGKIVSDSFGNIFANDVYMNATYDEKAKALTSLMEYSKGKALEDLGLVPNYTSGNANVKQIKNYIDSGLDVSNAIMYDSMINPIKSDLDADGKAISGTLQGKKAYTIMNMQISDNAKDTMLDLITTSKNPETVNTLGKLSTQQQFIEYYSLNRSDTFVMEKFSRDDYDVATTKFNIDGKEFMKAVNGLSEIKSDIDKNGKTIENSKKNKTIQYINTLPLSSIQKIYMYGMAGYSVKQWRNELYNHINSLPMTSQEKKDLWKQLGLE